MYEEFVESFQSEGPPRRSGGPAGPGSVKAFVRGGVVAPGSSAPNSTVDEGRGGMLVAVAFQQAS